MKFPMPQSGTYVVAVSGGVDSMALLSMLSNASNELDLVVAHYDHGIRDDSYKDRELVQAQAASLGLPFFFQEGKLGTKASEAAAREARYGFLRDVQNKLQAQAIITAHHQDDLLETLILNILRGTGPKGLSSLNTNVDLIRPLLTMSKAEIIDYATEHSIAWREDSTNQDTRYLRNHIRHSVVPKLSDGQRQQLLAIAASARIQNEKIDSVVVSLLSLQSQEHGIDRDWFMGLPHAVSLEIMAGWLRSFDIRDFDRPLIERLVVGAKTAIPGKRLNVRSGWFITVSKNYLALVSPER